MEIVTFEIAKKLKGKSFPQKTAGRYSMIDCFYYEDGRLFFHGGACDVNEAYTAPTISQVLKWLREEKNTHIEIYANASGYDYIISDTPNLGGNDKYWNDFAGPNDGGCWDTYEECALAGIEYVLNNLI